jgi:hypothetical protein
MKTPKTPTTFQTPHEAAKTKKKATAVTAQKAVLAPVDTKIKKGPRKAKAKVTTTGRDAFGGRIGTRMSTINLVVINAGAKGATVPEVAEKTGESAAIVSAQLGWAANKLKVATRNEEKPTDGRKTFRYFAKI